MPRENRRRGKRKKNDIQEDLDEKEPVKLKELEDEGQPSWIETGHLNETSDPDAPFGLCDPDIKAYFRSVENQLKEWQDLGIEKENVSEEDSNLERRMFFSAALTEMQGKECMLATDPDCAVILERMIYSMDDLARRIFMNNLIGSVVELAKHRFGSHVLETLFELGASTVSRETQGILPTAQALPQFADQPTMSNLVAQFCKEITPTSPALVNEQFASHILVALESALGLTNKPDSLMDRILVGMISGYSVTPESIPPPSDYLATLLRDATASHLLETVVQHMPDGPFSQLWRVYFSGKLHRLAIHPVANFVVANTFERLNNNDFPEAVQEMEKVLAKSFKQHRIGPVTSLVKRAGAIKVSEDEVINAICMALGIDVNEPVGLIERILVTEGTADGQTNGEEQATTSQAPPSVQGALLLQAMLLLSAPHNEVVIRSFELMSKQTKIALAHDPTSSRVIDAMLESPVVTRKGKRGVIMGYLGQYEQLVDDRIGSR
ncbi:Nucleolar protein 9, partial [Serendipita sp. 407]